MTLTHINHLISEYIDGTLPRPKIQKVKSHMVFCNSCRKIFKETEKLLKKLNALTQHEPPAGLEEKIISELTQAQNQTLTEPVPAKKWTPQTKKKILFLAMGVGIFCVVVLLVKSCYTKPVVPSPIPVIPEKVSPIIKKEIEPPQNPPVKPPQLSGQNSGIHEALNMVISSQKELDKIWKSHMATVLPPQTAPSVNFKDSQIIAIFGGNQPTGGYLIDILEVRITEWEGKPARIVRYRLISPPDDSFNTAALTQPFIFKIVPKINGKTYFRKRP